jgi:two-component system LytT family response regulator
MTAIIVDDEKHCRDVLGLLLQKHCPTLHLVASCSDGQSAVEAIEMHHPDLVFLDIEMPGMSGFDMLEACRFTNFEVIFTTAYNEYAIKAIRHNALDYILKPIDKDELIQAVARTRKDSAVKEPSRVDNFIDFLTRQKMGDRIALPTSDGLHILQSEEIWFCESEGGYTRFFLTNGKVSLISKTLKEVEDVLETKGFCRVHNSYLINLRYVQKYIRGDGGEVIMANGKNIPVSRNKKQEFLNCLEKI